MVIRRRDQKERTTEHSNQIEKRTNKNARYSKLKNVENVPHKKKQITGHKDKKKPQFEKRFYRFQHL